MTQRAEPTGDRSYCGPNDAMFDAIAQVVAHDGEFGDIRSEDFDVSVSRVDGGLRMVIDTSPLRRRRLWEDIIRVNGYLVTREYLKEAVAAENSILRRPDQDLAATIAWGGLRGVLGASLDAISAARRSRP